MIGVFKEYSRMDNCLTRLFVLLLAAFYFGKCLCTLNYISPLDKTRLKRVVDDGWKLTDVSNVHYAVASYKILEESLPVSEQVLCDYITKISSESDKLEDFYHIVSTWKLLTSCKKPFAAKNIPSLTSTTLEDKFYWSYINEHVGDNSSKSIPPHRPTLTVDDSIVNVGYALHLATFRSISTADTRVEFNKIWKTVLRADEIDGQYLQFEGGLTATAMIVNGIYKVAEKLNEIPALTNEQVVKFARYFISRVTVSRPKGIYYLLSALHTLVNNKFHIIASVESIEKSVTRDQKSIAVRVSNLLGHSLIDKSAVNVEAKYKNEEEKKVRLVPSASEFNIVYTFNPKDLKLGYGFFSVDILLSATKDALGKKVIVNPVNPVTFVISTTAVVSDFQIGVVEADRSSLTDALKVDYGNTLDRELSLDSLQRLIIKFSVQDSISSEALRVHQSFVKFTHIANKQDIVFVATTDSANNYRLYLDVSSSAEQFRHMSGKYSVTLILADSLISPPIIWTVATVNLRFPTIEEDTADEDVSSYYLAKPEIKHIFKEPEKRPPAIVSLTFTILVLTPLLILLLLWSILGVNIKNFPFTLSAIGFHGGLACIFVLFGLFWLTLNMFQTIKYLVAMGVVTFMCGHKMLVGIACKRGKTI